MRDMDRRRSPGVNLLNGTPVPEEQARHGNSGMQTVGLASAHWYNLVPGGIRSWGLEHNSGWKALVTLVSARTHTALRRSARSTRDENAGTAAATRRNG